MAGFWKRRGRGSDLEGVLRDNRPAPRAEFVRLLTARIHESRPRVAARRVAVAAALTLVMAAALTAFGGIGYAGTAAERMGELARGLNTQDGKASKDDKGTPRKGKPSHDQYQEERKRCRRAAKQQHLQNMREIRRDFQECKREENRRHNAAMRACNKDRDCERAEKARHQEESRRCREEFQRRKREEQERYRAALEACKQIGGGGDDGEDEDDD
jgi:hypothetical protein